ncbi:putative CSE1-nuclear envelope protein that mediates the nuclear export of importin alpha [Tilletiaria anomala UBC 951]|uniref:Putative CSE1-nuclear envelope protein that mediates the nuclear export of importin alpha n=1 Tax=Tilletiaria anomala (strain ATCC 24038 / CBS 436.72 / UBC 951) TaxID=1037660 RepID=A0A066VN61_TILAU|nr:putative CSE1-nuclear envelope protein that mediates the nuclear export of importin alpha [Tilletiaria anomala UBC 951]KDN43192.1 putative CSE1-nuclear envelope protein that mediates the nuclear export of importin alpha [Tilletiaria anomala UBC 951]
MDAHVASLAGLFQVTLQPDPGARKAAEAQITAAQSQPGFPQLLLSLIEHNSSSSIPLPTRLAAAINLKNLCKNGWADSDDHEGVIAEADKQTVRLQVLPLLFRLASSQAQAQTQGSLVGLRTQLREAVAHIAEHDFPQRWPSLIEELVSRLNEQDHSVLMTVLQTSHSIFRRWRSAFRTDALWTQINLVLGVYAEPFLQLLQRTDATLNDAETPSASILPLTSALSVEIQIFYDLSVQDLPPHFEDNLDEVIVPILMRWLSFSRPELAFAPDDDSTEAGPLEKVRAGVCEVGELYAQKYPEEFSKHLGPFVQAVWQMLGTCGQGERYDVLVAKATGLLSTIVRMGSQKVMFEAEDTLRQFVTAIILPNAQLRESDEELFEDNPIEYIRRDLETSAENDTRRKASSDFTRALMQHFGQTVTGVMEQYIAQFLAEYRADPVQNWKQKDTAIYLLTSIAVGGSTAQHGVSSVNALIDVVKFFSDNVFADLQASSTDVANPILQVDAIKFLHTFRNQLTKEQLLSVLPLLVQHLESGNYVTCSYAAITIERILFLKTSGSTSQPLFSPADVQPFSETILMACFRTIMAGGTPEKIAENDYLMKCVMRLIMTSRHTLAPFHSPILQQLTNVLAEISKNPSNPKFNQFVFESISALIRFVVAADASTLSSCEQSLFGPFTTILQSDVVEFVPFVFQILAQMLEQHTSSDLPEAYVDLLPPLLTATLWQQRGNVPALVRLFQSFLARGAQQMVANGQITPVMGIYQQLINSRINDLYGFGLLQSVFEHIPETAIAQYRKPVLTLMLTRMQTGRTDKFVKGFVYFVSYLACIQKQEYPQAVVSAFDEVQPGLFSQLLQGIIAPELAQIPQTQRRVVFAGITRLITEAPAMLQAPNVTSLPSLLRTLLPGILRPSDAIVEQDEQDDMAAFDLEEFGFQTSFSQLAASQPPRKDPSSFAGGDLKAYLLRQLAAACMGHPNVLKSAVEAANSELAAQLVQEMQQAGLSLA